MEKKERLSNFEILRILAIMGVIVLHYNNRIYGNAFGLTEHNPVNHCMLMILESLCICSVDLFVIISGFFLSSRQKRNGFRIIELMVQVMFFSELKYLVTNRKYLTLGSLLGALLPNNYFVTLYAVLFFISPLINVMLDEASRQNALKRILITLFCVFSIIPFCIDILSVILRTNLNGMCTIGANGDQYGYTIVNFFLLYVIGAYLRNIQKKVTNLKLLAAIVVLIMVITCISYWNENVAWEYCSPFVILLAVCLFLLFSNFNIGSIKLINELSGSVFTCFLVHGMFISHIHIDQFANMNPILLFLHVLISTLGIYLVSWFVWKCWNLIFKSVTKKIDEKKFIIDFFHYSNPI